MSPIMLLQFVAPLAVVVGIVIRLRGSRQSGGLQNDSQNSVAPDPRFAPDPTGGLSPAQDPRFAYQPDPRFGSGDSSYPPTAAAATSVLASAGVSPGGAQSDFVPSSAAAASGDPFPTRGRAVSLVGGQTLSTLGLLVLLLTSRPSGHHMSHATNSSIAFLALFCAFVGCTFSTVAAGRIQRDVMGGGWNARFALQYISPQIVLYVNSPTGISDAARRLSIPPALAVLVVYGLFASDVLLIAARYFGH